jgi:hypothetical protein
MSCRLRGVAHLIVETCGLVCVNVQYQEFALEEHNRSFQVQHSYTHNGVAAFHIFRFILCLREGPRGQGNAVLIKSYITIDYNP